jgi:hypothetical protein
MAQMAAASTASSAQYLIYTFDFPSEGQRAQSRWHRYAALADEELALAQAQILSDTNKYRRVEVKKKYFDSRRGRAIDLTLRVYEQGLERKRATMLGFMAGIGAIAVGAALIIALF